MKKQIYLFFIITLLSVNAFADNYPTGAGSLAMGNATVAVPNLWSSYHNQGALGYLEGMQVGIFYENRFNLPEFGLKSFAFAMNTKPGTFAVDFSSFGFKNFSDNKFGLAYAMKLFDYLAVGIQLDYIYVSQENYYGNINNISGEIGLLAIPFENFYLAAHVFNPWRSKISKNNNERLPTIFRLGAAYDFSEKLKVSTEVMKDLDLAAFYKTGIQYEPVKNFMLRTGVQFSKRNTFLAFGLGYTFKKITIDLGYEQHPILGAKSGISIMYRIK